MAEAYKTEIQPLTKLVAVAIRFILIAITGIALLGMTIAFAVYMNIVPVNASHAARAAIISLGPPAKLTSTQFPVILGSTNPNAPLVVIDAGHGGHDPGAISVSGIEEKHLTLALAQKIQTELASGNQVRVALTRDEDKFLPLVERYRLARRMGADFFISVHADAAPKNKNASGATVYTLSEIASDKEGALLAARENDERPGNVTSSDDDVIDPILANLTRRESAIAAAAFADLLHREASPAVPFTQDYHRYASFVVLKAPDVPSILFEAGYLTNVEDESFILSEEGQQRIATSMRKAIEIYFDRNSYHEA